MASRSERQSRDDAFFDMIETHRARAFVRVMRALPSGPRCAICRAPFAGIGGRILGHVGFGPSRKNPRLCAMCFEKVPVGGVQMDVGVLFADVRGFTSLAERQDAAESAALLNRFYQAAVDVLCRHAIIDKLVGDQVMALYLPGLLDAGVTDHMVADALDVLAGAPAQLDIGIGLDFGPAFVGNVGSGAVRDFTAIGDVVNTAARLEAAAAAGEMLVSRRVIDLTDPALATGEPRALVLKGKAEAERVVALRPSAGEPRGA